MSGKKKTALFYFHSALWNLNLEYDLTPQKRHNSRKFWNDYLVTRCGNYEGFHFVLKDCFWICFLDRCILPYVTPKEFLFFTIPNIVQKRWLLQDSLDPMLFLYLNQFLAIPWKVLHNPVFPKTGPQPGSGGVLQLAIMFSSPAPVLRSPTTQCYEAASPTQVFTIVTSELPPGSSGINERFLSGTSEKGQHSIGKCPIWDFTQCVSG